MADPRHELGRRAEQRVAEWLVTLGWTLLGHRWRCRAGELDLVLLDPQRRLVGVEVRARRSARTGFPLDSLTPRHRARLRAALVEYAIEHRVAATGLRVDLVTAEPVDRRQPGAWRLVRHPNVDGW